MNIDSMPINLYHKYRQENCSPVLLESLGPQTPYSSRRILGVRPRRTLVISAGTLFENNEAIGTALDIFSHLDLPKSASFFPAWMGFFSYEFSRHLGLPTKDNADGFPEAVFHLFEDGFVWEGGQLVEEPKHFPATLPKCEALASDSPLPKESNVPNVRADDESFFASAFSEVANSITRGDVYQVNIAQRFSFDGNLDFLEIYKRLRVSNPCPFMGLMEDKDWGIACASPERLFRYKEGVVSSRPIAGTRKRSSIESEDIRNEHDLRDSAKERAEHAMLVDLVRNDLSCVCEPGTVQVDEAFIVERYSHVMHLVSEISGQSASSLKDVFAALFPAGTITGTPKESAMDHIKRLEPYARGPYTGSMGYVSGRDGADFNILIRSALRRGSDAYIWAGAGIVAQSNAPSENDEVAAKAQSVSNVLRQIQSPSKPALPMKGQRFALPNATPQLKHRVLFIENHDSFSHNIIHALQRLGCSVDVVDHATRPLIVEHQHVILGPGPRSPTEAARLMDWLDEAIDRRCAILGICLGHQALGIRFGAQLEKARRAIHGECALITHTGHRLFKGIPSRFEAMRYHSLVLNQVPACFEVISFSDTDEVMAIAHKERPWYGVQFHPESFLSEGGDQLLHNFFEMKS